MSIRGNRKLDYFGNYYFYNFIIWSVIYHQILMQKISNASDILKLYQRGLEFSIITVILNKDYLFVGGAS